MGGAHKENPFLSTVNIALTVGVIYCSTSTPVTRRQAMSNGKVSGLRGKSRPRDSVTTYFQRHRTPEDILLGRKVLKRSISVLLIQRLVKGYISLPLGTVC